MALAMATSTNRQSDLKTIMRHACVRKLSLPLLAIGFLGQPPAQSLPFESNCNALESQFNAVAADWQPPVQAIGLTGWYRSEAQSYASCGEGILIRYAPEGPEACRLTGELRYPWTGVEYIEGSNSFRIRTDRCDAIPSPESKPEQEQVLASESRRNAETTEKEAGTASKNSDPYWIFLLSGTILTSVAFSVSQVLKRREQRSESNEQIPSAEPNPAANHPINDQILVLGVKTRDQAPPDEASP